MIYKNRTFLLGAGFSKAVADGPLLKDLWCYIEKAYKREKNRTDISQEDKKLRMDWYDYINEFITKLEKAAISRFRGRKFGHEYNPSVDMRENLEYVFTLIDLHRDGPLVRFERKGADVQPYPAIPFQFITRDELDGVRRNLQTYIYLVLNRLKFNELAEKFAEIIAPSDQIITFNYDLVLEKSLLHLDKWYPLNGYVGVHRFEIDSDGRDLEDQGKRSKIQIHKMHGSINWRIPEPRSLERLQGINEVMIVMDDWENNGFHFDGSLQRQPDKTKSPYVGRHEPESILPSFVKPFKEKEIFRIWQSAMRFMSNTKELVIIGYSFRPEDSNAFPLLSILPKKSERTLVDRNREEVKERLESKGLKVVKTYKCLEDYLAGK